MRNSPIRNTYKPRHISIEGIVRSSRCTTNWGAMGTTCDGSGGRLTHEHGSHFQCSPITFCERPVPDHRQDSTDRPGQETRGEQYMRAERAVPYIQFLCRNNLTIAHGEGVLPSVHYTRQTFAHFGVVLLWRPLHERPVCGGSQERCRQERRHHPQDPD